MNRAEYIEARRRRRANGAWSFRWMPAEMRAIFDELQRRENATDYLANRAIVYLSPNCPQTIRDRMRITAPLHIYLSFNRRYRCR